MQGHERSKRNCEKIVKKIGYFLITIQDIEKSCGPFFAVVKVKVLTYLTHINYNVGVLGTISILRQQKDLVGGWVDWKMTIFADVQYYIYDDIVQMFIVHGWVRKSPKIC